MRSQSLWLRRRSKLLFLVCAKRRNLDWASLVRAHTDHRVRLGAEIAQNLDNRRKKSPFQVNEHPFVSSQFAIIYSRDEHDLKRVIHKSRNSFPSKARITGHHLESSRDAFGIGDLLGKSLTGNTIDTLNAGLNGFPLDHQVI